MIIIILQSYKQINSRKTANKIPATIIQIKTKHTKLNKHRISKCTGYKMIKIQQSYKIIHFFNSYQHTGYNNSNGKTNSYRSKKLKYQLMNLI